jgi:hypothetical protein
MAITLNGDSGITTPTYGGADTAEYLVPVTACKNRLINSQLLINQRGVSGTVSLSAGAYGHDRFKAGSSGCTYTFATSNNVTTLTITAGSLQQVIEGLNLESGTYTLSWTGTAQGKIGAGSYGASGITGSITGGTNTTIEFNTGTLSLPQLEKGSAATSFDYRPYTTELALCQRYFIKYGGDYGLEIAGSGQAVSTTATFTATYLPVDMRTQPSISFSGIAAADGVNAVTNLTNLAINTSVSSSKIIALAGTAASGLTQYRPYYIRMTSTSSSLQISAEL